MCISFSKRDIIHNPMYTLSILGSCTLSYDVDTVSGDEAPCFYVHIGPRLYPRAFEIRADTHLLPYFLDFI